MQITRGIPDFSWDPYAYGYSNFNTTDLEGKSVALNTNDISQAGHMYLFRVGSTPVETEPDIFTFNFMGHSGKFIFAGKQVYVFDTNHPHGEYSVEVKKMNLESGSPFYSRIITITTGDGYKFTFLPLQEPQIPFLASRIRPALENWQSLLFENQTPAQSWYLTKIVAPNRRVVSLEYQNSSTTNITPKNVDSIVYTNFPMAVIPKLKYELHPCPDYQLKKISIDNKVDIDFINKTGSLDTILVTNKMNSSTGTVLRKCVLNYKRACSSVYTSASVALLSSVNISGVGIYQMDYYDEDKDFPLDESSDIDHWGYYNAGYYDRPVNSDPDDYRHPGDLKMEDITLPTPDYFTEVDWNNIAARKPNSNFAKRGMLSKLTYPTGGYTTFEYEAHQFQDIVTRDRFTNNMPVLKSTSAQHEAGGLRIKTITNYPLDGAKSSKTFLYLTADGKSSGNLLIQPFYFFYMNEYDRAGILVENRSLWLANSGSRNSTQPHVEYERVMEVDNDGSYVVYNFANYHDTPDQYQSSSTRPNTLINPNMSVSNVILVNNFLMEPDYEPPFRGTLLATSYYNSSNKLVKQIEYTYDKTQKRKFVESVKYAADRFYIQRSYLESYPLTSMTTRIYEDERSMVTEETYTYNALGQMSCVSRKESDGSVISDYVTYVSDLSEFQIMEIPGQSTVYNMMLKCNVLDLPIYTKKSRTTTLADRPGVLREQLIEADRFEYTVVADSMIRAKAHAVAKIPTLLNITSTPAYYTLNTYDKYDAQGRLLQTTDHTGIKKCYVWGYNGLYPVAEIIGVDYSKIQEVIKRTTPFATTFTANEETSLRGLSGAFVTTYTYIPYIGVTGIKDFSGRSKYYTYYNDEGGSYSKGKLKMEYDDEWRAVRKHSYSVANE